MGRRVDEPRFSVELHDGDFEVRRYEPRVVAETLVTGPSSGAANEGFRRLAGYIFGGNRGRASIAMTAPVSQRRAE
ncbi:MAG: heme-binding protein, partial [Deltaproteobacteria bacterium]